MVVTKVGTETNNITKKQLSKFESNQRQKSVPPSPKYFEREPCNVGLYREIHVLHRPAVPSQECVSTKLVEYLSMFYIHFPFANCECVCCCVYLKGKGMDYAVTTPQDHAYGLRNVDGMFGCIYASPFIMEWPQKPSDDGNSHRTAR